MSRYTIGEVAGRSGFSASALRYYDGIGLVAPSTRTASGYRRYDDAALDRLTFIARAKQLGCTLEEITDLASIWDGQRCGPVQRRFHDLITDKIRDARAQVIELTAFAAQLRAAAELLRGEPVDGPCDAECACLAKGPDEAPGVPIACTLDPGSIPDRRAEWAAVLATATDRVTVEHGVRIEFGSDVDLAELGRLLGAEQQCCTFVSFTLSVDADHIALQVQATEAAETIDDLFGTM